MMWGVPLPHWLDRINLGSFNTHLGVALGGGLAVILSAFLGIATLGIWFSPIIGLGVLGLLSGLAGMAVDAWRSIGGVQPKQKTESTDGRNALRVRLDREEWFGFQHRARILAIEVSIRNRTSTDIRFDGTSWRNHLKRPSEPGGTPVPGLQAELDRIKRDRLEALTLVPAHKTVRGWYLRPVEYDSEMGQPEYVWVVHTQVGGHEYGFRRIGNPKRAIEL
jgi:hypothetical protein